MSDPGFPLGGGENGARSYGAGKKAWGPTSTISNMYPWLLGWMGKLQARLPDIQVPTKALSLGFVTLEQLKSVIRQLSPSEIIAFNKLADEPLQIAIGTEAFRPDEDTTQALLDAYMSKLKTNIRASALDDAELPVIEEGRRSMWRRDDEGDPAYMYMLNEHERQVNAVIVIQRRWRKWHQFCKEHGRPLHAVRRDIRRAQADLRMVYAKMGMGSTTRMKRYQSTQEMLARYHTLQVAESLLMKVLTRNKAVEKGEEHSNILQEMRNDLNQLCTQLQQINKAVEVRTSNSGSNLQRGSSCSGAEQLGAGKPTVAVESDWPTRLSVRSDSRGRYSYSGAADDFKDRDRDRDKRSLLGGIGSRSRLGREEAPALSREASGDLIGPPSPSTPRTMQLEGLTPVEKARRVAADMLLHLATASGGNYLSRPNTSHMKIIEDDECDDSDDDSDEEARPSKAELQAVAHAAGVQAEANQMLRNLMFDKAGSHLALLDKVTGADTKSEMAAAIKEEVDRLVQAQLAQQQRQKSQLGQTAPRPRSIRQAQMQQQLLAPLIATPLIASDPPGGQTEEVVEQEEEEEQQEAEALDEEWQQDVSFVSRHSSAAFIHALEELAQGYDPQQGGPDTYDSDSGDEEEQTDTLAPQRHHHHHHRVSPSQPTYTYETSGSVASGPPPPLLKISSFRSKQVGADSPAPSRSGTALKPALPLPSPAPMHPSQITPGCIGLFIKPLETRSARASESGYQQGGMQADGQLQPKSPAVTAAAAAAAPAPPPRTVRILNTFTVTHMDLLEQAGQGPDEGEAAGHQSQQGDADSDGCEEQEQVPFSPSMHSPKHVWKGGKHRYSQLLRSISGRHDDVPDESDDDDEGDEGESAAQPGAVQGQAQSLPAGRSQHLPQSQLHRGSLNGVQHQGQTRLNRTLPPATAFSRMLAVQRTQSMGGGYLGSADDPDANNTMTGLSQSLSRLPPVRFPATKLLEPLTCLLNGMPLTGSEASSPVLSPGRLQPLEHAKDMSSLNKAASDQRLEYSKSRHSLPSIEGLQEEDYIPARAGRVLNANEPLLSKAGGSGGGGGSRLPRLAPVSQARR